MSAEVINALLPLMSDTNTPAEGVAGFGDGAAVTVGAMFVPGAGLLKQRGCAGRQVELLIGHKC